MRILVPWTFFACTFGVLLYVYCWKPSLTLGEMQWVYLGDNISIIRAHGKNLIGPGHIELHVSSNLVYGVFSAEDDFEGRWFAIERDTLKTYVRERPEEIESVLKTHNERGLMRTNTSGSFFKTFQSLRDAMAHE